MRWLIALSLLAASACTLPTSPTPVAQNRVCPTGCPVPPGCHTELSPPNNPIGYVLRCP